MNRSKAGRYALVAMCGLLSLVWVAFFLNQGNSANAKKRIIVRRSQDSLEGVESTDSVEIQNEVIRKSNFAEDWTYIVSDKETGVRIAAAKFIKCKATSRRISVNASSLKGLSDECGVFHYRPAEKEAKDGLSQFYVYKDGYQAQRIASQGEKKTVEINLSPANAFMAQFVDWNGGPVKEVRFYMSKMPINATRTVPFENGLPGGEENFALHCGRSDENGLVKIDGLSPGKYYYRVYHPFLVPVQGSEEVGIIDSGEFEKTWIMADIYGAVIKVKNAKIISYVSSCRGMQGDSVEVSSGAIVRKMREIAEQWKGCIGYCLVPPFYGTSTFAEGTKAKFYLVLSNERQGVVEVPVKPLKEMKGPLIVNADGFGQRFAAGRLKVIVKDRGGERCDMKGLRVLNRNFSRLTRGEYVSFVAKEGAEYPLPSGGYKVKMANSALPESGLVQKVEIKDSRLTVCEFNLKNKYSLCKIELRFSDPSFLWPSHPFYTQIDYDVKNGPSGKFYAMGREEYRRWLPVGELIVGVAVPGFKRRERSLHLGKEGADCVFVF